jgi:hypothetical protein
MMNYKNVLIFFGIALLFVQFVFASSVVELVLEKNPGLIKGDVDNNGLVNIFDLAIVGKNYGERAAVVLKSGAVSTLSSNSLDGDTNGDGVVDVLDLAIVGKNYDIIFPQQSGATSVFVSPSYKEVKVNEEFKVSINIATNTNVFASEAKVLFDPDLFEVILVSEGDFLKKGASTFPIIKINNTIGEVSFAITRFGVSSGASGNGSLVIIDFKSKDEGDSEVKIENLKLVDSNLQEILDVKREYGLMRTVGNRAPVITSFFPVSEPKIYEGQNQKFNVSYYDPDGDAASVKWYVNGLLATSSTNSYTFFTNYESAGAYIIEAVVSDSNFKTASKNWTVEVINVNRVPTAPTLIDLSPKTANTSSVFSCVASGSTDADGDSISYYYEFRKGSSVLKSYSTSSSYDCATPGCNKNDDITCYAKAYDGTAYSGEKNSNSVKIMNSAPTAPTLIDLSPKTANTSSVFSCVASGSTDADGDSISYYYEFRKGSSVLKSYSTSSSYDCATPGCNKNDDITCYAKAYDGTAYSGEKNSNSVKIMNSAPRLNFIGNKKISEESTLSFKVSASDADNDVLTYSAINLPSGAKLNSSSGDFTWKTSFGDSGEYSVTFFVYDSDGFVDSEVVKISVSFVNRAPKILSYYPVDNPKMNEKSYVKFGVSASDPDKDELYFDWYSDGKLVKKESSFNASTFIFDSFNYNDSGTYKVRVVISDGELTDSKEWSVSVIDSHSRIYLTGGSVGIFSLPRMIEKSFNELETNCVLRQINNKYALAYYEPNSSDIGEENYKFLKLNDVLYGGQGYFISVENDCYIEVSGEMVTQKDIGFKYWDNPNMLKAGWNLLGSTTLQSLFSRGGCELYDNIGPLRYAYGVSSCKDVKGYDGRYEYCPEENGVVRCRCSFSPANLVPGEGYWIRVKNDCTLS